MPDHHQHAGRDAEADDRRVGPIDVRVFTDIRDIPPPARDALAYRDDLFFSLDWYDCLIRYGLAPNLSPRIYVASDGDGRPACCLFLAQDGRSRTLRALTGFYAMEYGPVLSSSGPAGLQGLRAIVKHIAAERPRWTGIHLKNLRSDSEAASALLAALREEKFALNRYFQFENWYCPIRGSDFAGYYGNRPSKVRNTIKRKHKKLTGERDAAIRIYRSDDLDAALAAYRKIYSKSWKDEEAYPLFIDNFVRLCAGLGILRLGVLTVDGAPAAAQIWIVHGKTALIYKLAYDENFADYSVGSILTKAMAEAAIDGDRVDEIDYGVGSEPYKRDWMEERRVIEGVEAFNRRTVGGAWAASEAVLRRRVKSLLTAARRSRPSPQPTP